MDIDGERIRLRPLRESDATERYRGWLADPEVTRYLECRFAPVPTIAALADYIEQQQRPDMLFMAIILRAGVRASDQHIGNIKLGPVNWQHNTADLGLLIGDGGCRGKGYGTEAIRLLTQYAFESLPLHKITASCYSTNEPSRRAFERAGYVVEGVRRAQYWSQGAWVDAVHMAAFWDDLLPRRRDK